MHSSMVKIRESGALPVGLLASSGSGVAVKGLGALQGTLNPKP